MLSIGQICDQGCKAVFDKYKMQIFKEKELLLQGETRLERWTLKNKTPRSKTKFYSQAQHQLHYEKRQVQT